MHLSKLFKFFILFSAFLAFSAISKAQENDSIAEKSEPAAVNTNSVDIFDSVAMAKYKQVDQFILDITFNAWLSVLTYYPSIQMCEY